MSKREENRYTMPTLDEMNRRAGILETLWKEFLITEGEEDLEYHVHRQNLFEVIKRQDQRMYYLEIFHGLDYPCEYKYMAIECFWLNTLKPFMVINEKSSLYDCPNEKFSLYLILSTIGAVFQLYKNEEEFVFPSKDRIKDILYDFKYCSLSREAMISFVETYADTYGVGIEFILDKKDEIAEKLSGHPIIQLFRKID